MPTTAKGRPRQISVNRTQDRPPTLAQMIREGQELAARIKRATKEALLEWFAQSERLNIARTHYTLRGERFIDFAERMGVDRASAYQLVKLLRHREAILGRCADEGRYYGWETCLYWFEKSPRLRWPRGQDQRVMSIRPHRRSSESLAQTARWMSAPHQGRQCARRTSRRARTA